MAAAAPYILMAASTAMSMSAEGEASDINAAQHARAARASYAQGTRNSSEIRRQGEVIKSDAAANMAGMGGVTDDAGAIEQLSDIEQVTDYNALSAIFEGQSRSDEHWLQRKEGVRLSKNRQIATALQGASSMYSMASAPSPGKK